jgi:competence protein ComEA
VPESPEPLEVPAVPVRPQLDGGARRELVARFDAWRGDPRAGVVVLVLVAVLAGALWFRSSVASSPARADEAAPAAGAAGVSSSSTTATSTTSTTELVVHVAGAVTRPGVVRLPVGARVVDALDAAGGPTADADLDRLNLAAPLTDGTRVAVPQLGEPAVPLDPAAPAGASGATGGVDATGPLDLNAATVEQLETLPGIGPTLAAAIVDERERNGPFRSVDDLERVRGIGTGRLDALRDLVRV